VDPNSRTINRVARSKWMLFGLAFLAVGLFSLSVLLSSRPEAFDLIFFSGGFVFIGAVFTCVRAGVIVDRQRRSITTWWGLLVPLYRSRTEYSVSQTDFVTLSREERKAGKGEIYVVFPVTLGGGGSDAITIHEPHGQDRARQLAEDLAKFLGLGIRDRSAAEEVVREAGTLDESLRERLRRLGRSVPLPVQAPGARAILSYGGIRSPTTIEIPPMPVGECVRWFLAGLLVAGVGAIVLEWWAPRRWDVAFGVPTLIMLLLVLVILLPVLIRAAILRERLVVSPHEIVVTRRDVFGTKTTRLAGAEIEDVALVQARGFGRFTTRVAIRSDRDSIELVAALSNPEEVRWLRDTIAHVLTVTFE